MAKKTPTQYATDDGKMFDDKKSAERHEELMAAKEEYETAKRVYARLLWSGQKTADGYEFDLTRFGDFYCVRRNAGMPSIERVSFFAWNCTLDENDETVIIHDENNGLSSQRTRQHRISELYNREANARLALAVALEEFIGYANDDIAAIRAKYGNQAKRN